MPYCPQYCLQYCNASLKNINQHLPSRWAPHSQTPSPRAPVGSEARWLLAECGSRLLLLLNWPKERRRRSIGLLLPISGAQLIGSPYTQGASENVTSTTGTEGPAYFYLLHSH